MPLGSDLSPRNINVILLQLPMHPDLESMIIKYKPAYWIHGHVHTPVRYNIDQTEIICNPHGYINEKYNGYDKELIIEV